MDDAALLTGYVDRQDQAAFAELVGRHGGWLQSAARRQLGDGHLAEDVTQAVFLLLSRRAKGITHTRLSGWLFLAMGYCVRETKRRQMQQLIGEKEAASMRREAAEEARWEEIAPELEEAVGKLGKKDREAVLLRFYEQQPLVEVGKALGISEEAARKRVDRAVEKLRGMLEKKGVTGTTAGLSAVLVGNVVEKMPEGLIERIVSTVGSGRGSTAAAGIAKGAMTMMTMGKVMVAAVVVVAVGIAAGAAALATGGATIVATPQGRSPASAPSLERTNMLFTDRARNVMTVANQEAEHFNHDYIGTEHILLGLVEESDSAGANVLKGLGADLPKVRAEVEKLIKSGPDKLTMEQRPQTPRAKMVIQYAMEEAGNLNQKYVGTEHILLGLLDIQDGIAAQALLNLGLNPDTIRAAVLKQLRPGVETQEDQQRPGTGRSATP